MKHETYKTYETYETYETTLSRKTLLYIIDIYISLCR